MDATPPVLNAIDVAILYRMVEPDAGSHDRALAARRVDSLRLAGRIRAVRVGNTFKYLRTEAIGALEREIAAQPLGGEPPAATVL